ncbi:hypothetical protein KGM_211836A, partial [Danaus plexippus plexippus]
MRKFNITSHKEVDRLPILKTGLGVEQLLVVPKVSHRTGEARASAMYGTIQSCSL